jgi:hypothetical protein
MHNMLIRSAVINQFTLASSADVSYDSSHVRHVNYNRRVGA